MNTTEPRELTSDELDFVSGGQKTKAGGTQTIIDIGPLRITGGNGSFGLGIKGGPGIIVDSDGGCVGWGGGSKNTWCW